MNQTVLSASTYTPVNRCACQTASVHSPQQPQLIGMWNTIFSNSNAHQRTKTDDNEL
jgi:hypothetical protein